MFFVKEFFDVVFVHVGGGLHDDLNCFVFFQLKCVPFEGFVGKDSVFDGSVVSTVLRIDPCLASYVFYLDWRLSAWRDFLNKQLYLTNGSGQDDWGGSDFLTLSRKSWGVRPSHGRPSLVVLRRGGSLGVYVPGDDLLRCVHEDSETVVDRQRGLMFDHFLVGDGVVTRFIWRHDLGKINIVCCTRGGQFGSELCGFTMS